MEKDLAYNLIHRFNIADALKRTAGRFPKRTIMHGARVITFRELDALVNSTARFLLASGIRRGDRVGLIAINSIEFIALFYACGRIGAALVPVNLLFSPDEIDYVLDKTRVKALLVDPVLLPKVIREWPNQLAIDDAYRSHIASFDSSPVEEFVANDDPVTIMFTSGTTAKPKGVVLDHLNWFAGILNGVDLGFDRSLKYLLALPLFHIAGLGVLNASVVLGAESVLLSAIRPELIFDAITRHKVSLLGFPATVWVGLAQAPGLDRVDLSGIRRAVVFQYLPTPVYQRWLELMPNTDWYNVWGQTETMGTGSATRPAELAELLRAPDPIGTESSVLDLRIVDDAMNDVEQGRLGEIVVRGPAITPGYFEDDDANRALFQGGWHHTGDIAYRDPSGCIYFVDRKKDMIKTGGENVASLEVEEALAMHPAVGEVAVFGVSDPYWIEKVVAAVILVSEATPQELEQFARTKIAGFKVPKEIHIVNELPKNPTGKVLKRELRKRFETATGAAG
jgi:fatty-acyl-CoA synthase